MLVQTAYRLPQEIIDKLKFLKKEVGGSQTWHVIKALNEYFDKTIVKKAVVEKKPVAEIKDIYLTTASQLASVTLERFPTLAYKINNWADDIRKLVELDKKTIPELITVWTFIDQHDNNGFRWGDNIRSPAKLRQKKDGLSYYDKMISEMLRGQASEKSGHARPSKQTPEQRITAQIRESELQRRACGDNGTVLATHDAVISTQVDKH